MAGIFITGTDTGCGKTQVGCAFAATARERGLRVRALKPIETGWPDAAVDATDACRLARAAQDERPIDLVCPYRFALPASPDVAAAAESTKIEVDRLDAAFESAAADADLVVVESAGGLLVPISADLDMAGLAARWELPLLIVARAALGTINHTLLTLEAARARGLTVAGIVVSHTQPALSRADRQNLDGLIRLLETAPVDFLGELAHDVPGRQRAPGSSPAAPLDFRRVFSHLNIS